VCVLPECASLSPSHSSTQVFHDGRAPTVAVHFSDGTEPYGVTRVPDTTDYIITDVGHHRVLRIDARGETVWASGARGAGRDQFDWPFDVKVVASCGTVVVSDFNNNRLQLLNMHTGAVTGCISPEGQYALSGPIGLAIDHDHIVLADQNNDRVLVFTLAGDVVRVCSSPQPGPGYLETPCGVAVDARGNILVVDQSLHRLVVFGPDGSTSHVETLQEPWGVLVDEQGRVFVSGGDLPTSFIIRVVIHS
jgi:tripartite motif-containing protein 71